MPIPFYYQIHLFMYCISLHTLITYCVNRLHSFNFLTYFVFIHLYILLFSTLFCFDELLEVAFSFSYLLIIKISNMLIRNIFIYIKNTVTFYIMQLCFEYHKFILNLLPIRIYNFCRFL